MMYAMFYIHFIYANCFFILFARRYSGWVFLVCFQLGFLQSVFSQGLKLVLVRLWVQFKVCLVFKVCFSHEFYVNKCILVSLLVFSLLYLLVIVVRLWCLLRVCVIVPFVLFTFQFQLYISCVLQQQQVAKPQTLQSPWVSLAEVAQTQNPSLPSSLFLLYIL